MLLPVVRSIIKGKWPDAVNVQKVDFVVPQVALWDEQSVRTKVSKKERLAEGGF